MYNLYTANQIYHIFPKVVYFFFAISSVNYEIKGYKL